MSEHFVGDISCPRNSHRIGDNRKKFLIKRLFFDNFMRRVTPSCRSWRRCISFFKSFSKWFQQIQHGVLHFLFSFKVSLGCWEFKGWYGLLYGKCNHEDEVFDVAFDYSLTLWYSGRFFHQKYPQISAKFLDADLSLCVWDHIASGGLNIQNCAWPFERSSSLLCDSEKTIPSYVKKRNCRQYTSFLSNVLPILSRKTSSL